MRHNSWRTVRDYIEMSAGYAYDGYQELYLCISNSDLTHMKDLGCETVVAFDHENIEDELILIADLYLNSGVLASIQAVDHEFSEEYPTHDIIPQLAYFDELDENNHDFENIVNRDLRLLLGCTPEQLAELRKKIYQN